MKLALFYMRLIEWVSSEGEVSLGVESGNMQPTFL